MSENFEQFVRDTLASHQQKISKLEDIVISLQTELNKTQAEAYKGSFKPLLPDEKVNYINEYYFIAKVRMNDKGWTLTAFGSTGRENQVYWIKQDISDDDWAKLFEVMEIKKKSEADDKWRCIEEDAESQFKSMIPVVHKNDLYNYQGDKQPFHLRFMGAVIETEVKKDDGGTYKDRKIRLPFAFNDTSINMDVLNNPEKKWNYKAKAAGIPVEFIKPKFVDCRVDADYQEMIAYYAKKIDSKLVGDVPAMTNEADVSNIKDIMKHVGYKNPETDYGFIMKNIIMNPEHNRHASLVPYFTNKTYLQRWQVEHTFVANKQWFINAIAKEKQDG